MVNMERRPEGGGARSVPFVLTEQTLRRWLSLLRRPDQLGTTGIGELLTACGHVSENPTPLSLGHAGAELLLDAIERLRPAEGASRDEDLPHKVLETCFIQGAKLFQAASRLGLSERQLTRERARSIALLKAELESEMVQAPRGPYSAEPIPTIRDFLERPAKTRRIAKALELQRLVNVHGPPGIGKTSLVAEFAAGVSEETSVLWYKFRRGINVTLDAILFELGEYLRALGHPELSAFMSKGLPDIDVAIASRLAIKGLVDDPLLLVFDDFNLVEEDQSIAGFVEEMVARLPRLFVITISRHRYVPTLGGAEVEINALARAETQGLLSKLGIDCDENLLRKLHTWTGGNPHLIKLAASWLKTATDEEVAQGVDSLSDIAEVQSFLLSTVTELLDSDDKALLQGASVFRDRFNDEALAFVTGRTRGTVMDASLRLVRAYVATRSRSGDSAFFHNSIKDYIYDRLEPGQRAELHQRAAEWYARKGRDKEAAFHNKRAEATE